MNNNQVIPFLLIAVAGLLFFWPLVDIHRQLGPLGRLAYFFLIWAALTGGYAWWSRSCR